MGGVLHDWDRDVSVIKAEITGLLARQKPSQHTGIRALLIRKIKLIQLEIDLDRAYEKLSALSGRDYLLLPKERTLLHWTRIFLEQAGKLRALRADVASRSLWLGLLETRLLGKKGGESVGTSELMEMSIRKANLLKTERYLGDALVKLKARRLGLVKRYEQLEIFDANQTASMTLGYRLGSGVQNAFESPILTILGDYIKTGVMPVIAFKEAEKARKLEERYLRDSQNLKTKVVNTAISAKKFEQAMKQLEDLELETLSAYETIKGKSPLPARPHIS